MNDEFHQLFDDSWDGWLSNRFSGTIGGIEMETSETEKAYVYTLKVPNMKENGDGFGSRELNLGKMPDKKLFPLS